MFKVNKLSLSKRLIAVSAEETVLRKCVHIPQKHSSTDFIVLTPNLVEHH